MRLRVMPSRGPKPHTPKIPKPKMWDAPPAPTDRKSLSQKQETRLSQELDVDLTRGSGNQPWPRMKGDAQEKRFVHEMKRIKGENIVVGPGVVGKVCREARMLGKDPVLVLTVDGMPEPLPKDWVVIPASLFRELFPKEEP